MIYLVTFALAGSLFIGVGVFLYRICPEETPYLEKVVRLLPAAVCLVLGGFLLYGALLMALGLMIGWSDFRD